ncbi:MAG TPA: ATP-binding protein [Candidatus Omnitrophota bacterium]|nr:ATP-binding protein [Candidatus Omnitrophota bacterium]
MQIKQKLFVLIGLICGFFGLFLILQVGIEKNRLIALADAEIKESQAIFVRQLELKTLLQKKLATDYANWGEMVSFVETVDKQWGAINIDSGLVTFQADYAWVYRPDFSLIYSSVADKSFPQPLVVPQDAIQSQFRTSSVCHFFFVSSSGIMEVFGATIVPSEDYKRKTPARGYFLVGTLIDQQYLKELSQLSGQRIFLRTDLAKKNTHRDVSQKSSLFFLHLLSDWKGKQIAAFEIELSTQIIESFSGKQMEFYMYYFLFVAAFLAIFTYVLNLWIFSPLRSISQALISPKKLFRPAFLTRADEFGSIARLISNFFKQEQELVLEREALKKAYHDLHQTQSQLVQIEKMQVVGVLSSGVAHEVKNPLGIIQQAVDYLDREIKPEETKQREVLEMIRSAVMRATKIIHDMLNFSRQSKLELTTQPFVPILSIALGLVERQLVLKNIVVHKQFNDNQALVAVDSTQIQQVLVNIFLNAVQAMPERGELTIRTSLAPASLLKDGVGRHAKEFFDEHDSALVCEIEDTGPGIPLDLLSKIFDPFFTTKSPGLGVGLGLSVSRSIIDNHQGLIYIENLSKNGVKVVLVLKVYTAGQIVSLKEVV